MNKENQYKELIQIVRFGFVSLTMKYAMGDPKKTILLAVRAYLDSIEAKAKP